MFTTAPKIEFKCSFLLRHNEIGIKPKSKNLLYLKYFIMKKSYILLLIFIIASALTAHEADFLAATDIQSELNIEKDAYIVDYATDITVIDTKK